MPKQRDRSGDVHVEAMVERRDGTTIRIEQAERPISVIQIQLRPHFERSRHATRFDCDERVGMHGRAKKLNIERRLRLGANGREQDK